MKDVHKSHREACFLFCLLVWNKKHFYGLSSTRSRWAQAHTINNKGQWLHKTSVALSLPSPAWGPKKHREWFCFSKTRSSMHGHAEGHSERALIHKLLNQEFSVQSDRSIKLWNYAQLETWMLEEFFFFSSLYSCTKYPLVRELLKYLTATETVETSCKFAPHGAAKKKRFKSFTSKGHAGI